jgi:hypothetical protein
LVTGKLGDLLAAGVGRSRERLGDSQFLIKRAAEQGARVARLAAGVRERLESDLFLWRQRALVALEELVPA